MSSESQVIAPNEMKQPLHRHKARVACHLEWTLLVS
jgi:hypothetical protein